MRQKTLLKRISTLVTALLIALPFQSPAVKFVLKQNINMRVAQGEEALMIRTGTLTTGTMVEIPDRVVKQALGNQTPKSEDDFERVIMTWLKSAGKLRSFPGATRIKRDYFFPVKVLSGPHKGKEANVAIQYLARRGGLKLTNIHDSEFFEDKDDLNNPPIIPTPQLSPTPKPNKPVEPHINKPPQPTAIPNKPDPSVTEGEGNCCNTSPQLEALENKLNPSLQALDKIKRKDIKDQDLDLNYWRKLYKKRFEQSCGQIPFDGYLKYLDGLAKKNNIPLEMLLGMVTQESGFYCHLSGDNGKSQGLFQIHDVSAYWNKQWVPVCTEQQKRRINQKSFATLQNEYRTNQMKANGTFCRSNPVLNTEMGIDELMAKYKRVNGSLPQENKSWNQTTEKERVLWKRALAAYNGGEAYVLDADKNLRAFEKRWNINVDENNWDNMRLFYLKKRLDYNTQQKMFGNVSNSKYTGAKGALSSLSYAEMIGGSSINSPGLQRYSLTEIWGWLQS